MDNKIFYLTGTQKMEPAVLQEPDNIPDDCVMIKTQYVGICGSDVGFYETGMVGPDQVPFPIILGHECAGTVQKIGKNVKKFKPGDLVCLEPGVPCGSCEYCRSGRYNLCPDVDFMAAPPFQHGALKEYIVHPEAFTYKLPENLDALDGAMMEPFAVGYHAAERGKVSYGKKVVVLGAGCIGLMTIMACKLMGAVDIVAVDLFPYRLDMAKKVGASAVINPAETDTIQAVLEMFPEGADVVFESAGSAVTTRQSESIVKPGGDICLVGMTHTDVPFDFFEIQLKEVSVHTVFRYANCYEKIIPAVAKGLVHPKEIVTNEFTFSDTPKAFETSVFNKKDIVKAVIRMD